MEERQARGPAGIEAPEVKAAIGRAARIGPALRTTPGEEALAEIATDEDLDPLHRFALTIVDPPVQIGGRVQRDRPERERSLAGRDIHATVAGGKPRGIDPKSISADPHARNDESAVLVHLPGNGVRVRHQAHPFGGNRPTIRVLHPADNVARAVDLDAHGLCGIDHPRAGWRVARCGCPKHERLRAGWQIQEGERPVGSGADGPPRRIELHQSLPERSVAAVDLARQHDGGGSHGYAGNGAPGVDTGVLVALGGDAEPGAPRPIELQLAVNTGAPPACGVVLGPHEGPGKGGALHRITDRYDDAAPRAGRKPLDRGQ